MVSTFRLSVGLAASVILLTVASCGNPELDRNETCPVTGQVYVDGRPAAGVSVFCRNVQGMDAEYPTVTSALTDEDGRFHLSTYETADGVPDGEYMLTFEWRDYTPFTGSYDGLDKLMGRYSKPPATPLQSVVVEGQEQDLGQIDLFSK